MKEKTIEQMISALAKPARDERKAINDEFKSVHENDKTYPGMRFRMFSRWEEEKQWLNKFKSAEFRALVANVKEEKDIDTLFPAAFMAGGVPMSYQKQKKDDDKKPDTKYDEKQKKYVVDPDWKPFDWVLKKTEKFSDVKDIKDILVMIWVDKGEKEYKTLLSRKQPEEVKALYDALMKQQQKAEVKPAEVKKAAPSKPRAPRKSASKKSESK